MKKLLFLVLFLSSCASIPSQLTKEEFEQVTTSVPPSPTAPQLQINGPIILITGQILEDKLEGVPGFIAVARDLKLRGITKLTLVVNGTGGYKHVGDKIIKALKYTQSLGIEVECVVPSQAASMDFIILQACSTRYALSGAELLFHPIRYVHPITEQSPELTPAQTAELRKDNLGLAKSLCTSLALNNSPKCAKVIEAFYAEKSWTAEELAEFAPGFIKVISGVDGPGEVYLINFL